MDANRLLGVLLAGVLKPARPKRARTTRKAARPARRRTAKSPPLIDVRIGGSRRTGSALAALASLAAEALAQATAPAPRPPPPAGPVPAPHPTPARGSPWSTAAPPPPPPDPVGAEDREALLVVRAMIAAARADGAIEADERRAIAAQLDQAGLEPEAREMVLAEFANPAPIEVLAREITDPVLAAQVYAACVIAIGAEAEGERTWLDAFARRTGLGAETVAAIERRLAAGPPQG